VDRSAIQRSRMIKPRAKPSASMRSPLGGEEATTDDRWKSVGSGKRETSQLALRVTASISRDPL